MIEARKQLLKECLRKNMNIENESELEYLTELFIRVIESKKNDLSRGRVIKKEQIERGEVKVTPVKWKKLD